MKVNERLAVLRDLLHGEPDAANIAAAQRLIDAWPADENPEVGVLYAQQHMKGMLLRMVRQRQGPRSWSTLVEVVDAWTDKASLEALMPHLLASLAQWPDHLRVAPQGWLEALVDNNTPAGWPLVRAIRPEGFSGAVLRRLLGRTALRQITVLDLCKTRLWQHQMRDWSAATHLRDLEELRSDHNSVGFLPHFLQTKGHFKHLKRLHIRANRQAAPTGQLRALLRGAQARQLTHLTLERFGLTAEDANALATAPLCQNLVSLDLSSNPNLGERGAAVLFGSSWPALKSLDMRNCGLGVIGTLSLVDSSVVRRLSNLNLRNNAITNVAAEALLGSPLPHLRALNMGANGLTSAAIRGLSVAFAEPGLERLALRDNQLDDDGAGVIAHCAGLQNLRILNLRSNQLTAAGAQALARSPYLKALRHLNLRTNPIGDKGSQALATSPIIEQVQRLDLSSTGLEDGGLVSLLQSPHLRAVTELSLRNNNVTTEGVKALIQSPLLAQLRRLDLRSNAIDDDAAELLAQAPNTSLLEDISLRENFLSNEGVVALIKGEGFEGLKSLNLKRNYTFERTLENRFNRRRVPFKLFLIPPRY